MSGQTAEDRLGSEETLRSNLKLVLPLLEQSGIVGLIEPINTRSVPGYFLHDFDTGENNIVLFVYK